MSNFAKQSLKRVIIIGGGFGGLHAAKGLRRTGVNVTLVDRQNYHLFQPLLYQVATGGLSPANIAAPLRSILSRQKNLDVLRADVTGFDLANQQVLLSESNLPYDYLIVAAGAKPSYFGRSEWEQNAPGLKTIEDATDIRRKILSAFERAEQTADAELRSSLLTFVIVGGGPTGVELAGAISELSRHTLRNDFRKINPEDARIIIIDASPRVLSVYPEKLADKGAKYLTKLGVTMQANSKVTEITSSHVTFESNDVSETIKTHTVLWAAGVTASPLAKQLANSAGIEVDRAGRIAVDEQLSITNYQNVMVIGDMALSMDSNSKPLPGVAPVAIQQGEYAAMRIDKLIEGKESKPFRYRDYGTMATIGRSAAVVSMGPIKLAGFFAWLIWLFVHLMQLVTFENRLLVLFQWMWSYVTHGRTARLITGRKADANENFSMER